MSKFIMLNTGRYSVRINVANICSYNEAHVGGNQDVNSVVCFSDNDNYYYCKETVDEIDCLLLSFGDGTEIRKVDR